MSNDFPAVFDALSATMRKHSDGLNVIDDTPGSITVESKTLGENGKPLWYGAVSTKKSYVSYHLMAVYVNPALLDDMTPELKKRMQGKSCFNFTTIDDDLFAQLDDLTKRGFADFSN